MAELEHSESINSSAEQVDLVDFFGLPDWVDWIQVCLAALPLDYWTDADLLENLLIAPFAWIFAIIALAY